MTILVASTQLRPAKLIVIARSKTRDSSNTRADPRGVVRVGCGCMSYHPFAWLVVKRGSLPTVPPTQELLPQGPHLTCE